MEHPSASELEVRFELSKEKANLACALCDATDNPEKLEELIEQVPETARYVRQLFSSPYNSSIWRRTVVLHALDVLIGTHGVEPLYSPEQEPHGVEPPAYEYCNAGDSYDTTIIYSREHDKITIDCWGDIAENWSIPEPYRW